MKRGHEGGRTRRLRAAIRTERFCYRCGQPIDWTIPYRDPDTGKVNLQAGTLEHIQSVALRPDLAEDRGNTTASHWGCNRAAGARAPGPGLGVRSRNW